MPKFFIEKNKINNKDNIAVVDGDNLNHIKNVFRSNIGDEIVLCDGEGLDYQAQIISVSKDIIEAKILKCYPSTAEADINITLFQGIPKADKMEWIIQKNIELGIKEIVPVICKRTIVKFNSDKDVQKKLQRWQKIALEAAKQSGRGIIPVIASPVIFKDAMEKVSNYDIKIIPYEKEKNNTLRQVLKNKNATSSCVFIGPEGGFDEDEITIARDSGIIPVTFGERILRTETASMTATAIIMYEFGCME